MLWFCVNLLFEDDGSVLIDDAHVDRIERCVETYKIFHGFLLDGLWNLDCRA